MQGSKTASVMEQYNIRPHKRYGQNFLKDDNILKKIVEKAGVTKEDTVIEIGPGLGALTSKLSDAAKKVLAVEIDSDLIPVLNDVLSRKDNIEIINADFLKTRLSPVLSKRNITGTLHVVANLPYYITTPVIMKLLEEDIPDLSRENAHVKSITVMVQNEVALRMQAGPGTKDYGALSLAVQYRAKAEIVMKVSPECFIPKPGVDSAVIRLSLYEDNEKPYKTENEEFLFTVIRSAFGQRRKMLINSLANASLPGVDKRKAEEALTTLGLDIKIRGESLSLEEFIKLSETLLK